MRKVLVGLFLVSLVLILSGCSDKNASETLVLPDSSELVGSCYSGDAEGTLVAAAIRKAFPDRAKDPFFFSPTEADFSEKGWKIVFSFKEPDESVSLYTMDVFGDDIKPLTAVGAKKDYLPSWSPDGKEVAFSRFESGDRDGVYVVNLDSGEERWIAPAGEGFNTQGPSWAPTGKRIAYVRSSEEPFGPQTLYLVDPDSHNEVAVDLGDGHFQIAPVGWSPDGRQLAVTVSRVVDLKVESSGDAHWRDPYDEAILYVVGADGQKARRFYYRPADEQVEIWGPDFSDDGERVMFRQTKIGDIFRQKSVDISSGLVTDITEICNSLP